MHRLIEEKRDELARLCVQHHVRRLEIFGSALTDRFNPESSDLDFLVEFEHVPPGQHADCYFGLLEDLETMFGRPVDLVEATAITNPYFRENVNETQVPIYGAA